MPSTPPTKKAPATMQSRLQDMWDLGLKNAAFILPIVGAVVIFLLYSWDVLKEGFVGALVALTMTLGPLAMAIPNATSQTKSKQLKYLVFALGAVWLFGLGFPVYHALFPPKAVVERTLEKGKPVTVDVGRARRLELVARGGFPGDAAGSGNYKLVVETGSVSESVPGTFNRTWQNVRVGRRGGMARQLTQHLTNLHPLGQAFGPQVTLKLEDLDESLNKQVLVALRPAGLPTWLFFVFVGLVLLGALAMDLYFEREKAHTYLFVAAVFAAVFAYSFPGVIGDKMVRGTIGAGIIAILWAGIGGFVIVWLLRLTFFGKKRAAKK
jgi:TM2 domain-containing membrane protein YozV